LTEDKIYFSFSDYANSLAELITEQNRSDSFVIALTGSWGCGKTTLVNLTLNKLDDTKFIKTTFNAWRYTKEDVVWRGFFINVIGALRKHITNQHVIEDRGWNEKTLAQYEELFSDTERSLYSAFTKEIPGEISVDTGTVAKTSIKLAMKFLPLGEIGSDWVERIFKGSKSDTGSLN